ncbi:hypothetical protein [Fervidibacter sacchari]
MFSAGACGTGGAYEGERLIWSALEGGDGDLGEQAEVWRWGLKSEFVVGASVGVGEGFCV